MLGVNQFTLVGKALDNAEINTTQAGKQFAMFHIGVPEIRNGAEVTGEFEVTCWGLAKDDAMSTVKAGRTVAVSGTLAASSNISTKTGNKYYSARLNASRVTVDDEQGKAYQKPVVENAYNPWAEIDDQKLPF